MPFLCLSPRAVLALGVLGLASSLSRACPALPPETAAALSPAVVAARAVACHPDVLAAERAADAARADIRTAAQRPNPQLTLGANSLPRQGMGSGSLWRKTFDHQIRIDQLIERGDKAGLRQAAAEAARDAALADLADARRQARAAALRGLHDLAAALARREETAATVALNDQSLASIERRVRAGDAAALDATRFRVDALKVQADLAQADADARQLRLQLATAIGAPEAAEQLRPVLAGPAAAERGAAAAASARPATSPSAMDDDVIDRRPDVVAARARLAAAQGQRAVVRAQRQRDVSVGVAFDHYPVNEVNTSGNGNTVSLSVSMPLFVRHGYEGESARAEADVASAEEALRRVRAAARADLLRAETQWRAARERQRIAVEQLLPAAERVAAGAELAYQRGASGVLDLLDARRALRAAHIDRINAEADLAKAAADLDAARAPIDGLAPPTSR